MTELRIDVFRVYGTYIPAEPAGFYGPGCDSSFEIDLVQVEDSDLNLVHISALTTWLEKKCLERIENEGLGE